jgi:hypothetical protein
VTTLASGTTTALGTNSWHALSLAFTGSTITARIDGTIVGTATDGSFVRGHVGFASGWNYQTQFDNLSVTALAGPIPPLPSPLRNVGAGRCLDVNGASQANGATAIIWDCHSGSNQQWTPTAAGELRVFGTKCLDALNQATAAGSPVGIWDCNGGANQRWTLNASGTIVGAQSARCLAPANGATAAGTAVVLADCGTATAQQWSRS